MKLLLEKYLFFWARLVIAERAPRIVGVTGSVGKTTTKEAIAAVLGHDAARPFIGLVGKSNGNLNTEIGLPLAILRFSETPKNWLGWLWLVIFLPFKTLFLITLAAYPTVLILEFAADKPGDIKKLRNLVQPDVAVVTAVGPAHLLQFKNLERVAREKSKLVHFVPPSGLVILGRDNSFTSAMSEETHATVKKIPGRGLELAQGIARAVAEYWSIPKHAVTQALADFKAVGGRLDVKNLKAFKVIDDSYNANPLSMELALDTLAESTLPQKARRVAFLGEMRELGEQSEHYHIEVGRSARQHADVVVAVGKHAQLYDGDYWFADSQSAGNNVSEIVNKGDFILVKGSRAVEMERVVHALQQLAKEGYGIH